MFNALTIFVLILLIISFAYNIWLAYVADRYETTIKKVTTSFFSAYSGLDDGETKAEVLDILMRDIYRDLND